MFIFRARHIKALLLTPKAPGYTSAPLGPKEFDQMKQIRPRKIIKVASRNSFGKTENKSSRLTGEFDMQMT